MSNNPIIDRINVKGIEYEIKDTSNNTAGATDTSSKLFLIGAESQAANPQTYSHDTAYVGTDGCLYSGGSKVLTSHQDIYNLTLKGEGTTVTTFDPNAAANSLDLVAGDNVTITPDATNKKITISATGIINPWCSTTGASTYSGTTLFTTSPAINNASATSGRFYPICTDTNGRAYVNVPWTAVTVDSSLSSTSTNPLQNKAIYEALNLSARSATNYLVAGINGSWKLWNYNSTGKYLDIRYGQATINSQSKTYSITFSKSMPNTNYTVVCGIFNANERWFWTPIVRTQSTSGCTIFVRGNASSDSAGSLFYLIIGCTNPTN